MNDQICVALNNKGYKPFLQLADLSIQGTKNIDLPIPIDTTIQVSKPVFSPTKSAPESITFSVFLNRLVSFFTATAEKK